MNLFNKKGGKVAVSNGETLQEKLLKPFKKSAVAARLKSANIIETAYDDQGTKGLAFGLQWKPIVTSGGRAAAEKIARAGGGTHYIFRGQQLGFGTLAVVKNAPMAARLFSASAVLARQHVGDCAYAIRIGEGEYWIASTRNASPTADDKFLTNSSDAEALAVAREVIARVDADGVTTDIYTNIDNNGFDQPKLISVEDILAVALISDDLLKPLPKQKTSIPIPVFVICGLVILFMAGKTGYEYWDAKERAKNAVLNQVQEEDPAVAWARTIKTWQAAVAAANPAGLTNVRASLNEIPLKWDGWVMTITTCIAGVINSGNPNEQQWVCTATYNREVGGKLTREINKIIPKNWSVAYTPLNQMIISWQVKQSGTTIDITKLPSSSYHKIETTSRLQKLETAFSQPVTFAFTPIEIAAPKKSDGSAYASVPEVEGLAEAAFNLRAPLRTIDAVLDVNPDVAWHRLTMAYAPLGSKPTINSSILSTEITGVLYAKK